MRAGRVHGDGPPARRHPAGEDGPHHRTGRARGATPRPSAASRWRWAGSATRPTGTACWSRRCDRDGNEAALLSFTPWGAHGLSLDLMRRDRGSDNGLIEFMVAELVARRAGPGRTPDLAELRRVPVGLRGGRADRRRAGAAGLARHCCCSSRAGCRWSRCTAPTSSTGPSGCPGSCASRTRDLATVAFSSGIAEGLRWLSPACVPCSSGAWPAAAPAAGRRRCRPVVAPEPDRRPGSAAVDPSRPGCGWPTWTRLRATGVDPYPPAVPRTATVAQVRAAHPGLPPDPAPASRSSVAGRVVLLPRPRRHLLRDAARLEWRPPGDADRHRSRRGGARPLARRRSTSATT